MECKYISGIVFLCVSCFWALFSVWSHCSFYFTTSCWLSTVWFRLPPCSDPSPKTSIFKRIDSSLLGGLQTFMNWFDSRFEMAFPSQPSAGLANQWPSTNIPKRVFDQKFFATACTATDRRWTFDSNSIDSRICATAAFAFGAVCKARCTRDRRITARASKTSTDWKLWIACLAALPGSLQYGFGLSVLKWPEYFCIFAHILYTLGIYMFCSTQCCHFNVVFWSFAWYFRTCLSDLDQRKFRWETSDIRTRSEE